MIEGLSCMAMVVLLASGCAAASMSPRASVAADYPPRAEYDHPATLREWYDAGEDRLVLESTGVPVAPGLNLALMATRPGAERVRPADSVTLLLSSFYRAGGGTAAFDGRLSLVLRPSTRDQIRLSVEHTRGSAGGDLVFEELIATVPLHDFLRVAAASTVAGHVCCRQGGPVFLEPTPEVVALLRDFASRLRPTSVP